jgi:hypothetical protein
MLTIKEKAMLALPSLLFIAVVFITSVVTNTVVGQVPSESLRKVQREFNDSIRPILETHCGDCHWGDDADADLNLEQYETIDQLLSGRKKWKKVLIRVAAKEMPPEDCDPIPDEDHAKLMAWVDQLLNSVDCTNINPGQVTIRRLNRTEYQNTIRDLTGVEYKTSGNFPVDDVGYGFDNIADVLSLSPILMEKYLKAAEAITLSAVKDPARSRKSQILSARDFRWQGGDQNRNNKLVFTSNATATAKFSVIRKGTYRAIIRASGDQAGKDPVKMKVDVNGKQRQTYRVTKTLEEGDQEFETTFRFLQTGDQDINVSFTNDFYQKTRRNEDPIDRNLHFTNITLIGPIEKSSADYGQLVTGNPGDSKEKQRKVARKSLAVFTSRAYRRPVKSSEVDRLMRLYDSAVEAGDSFEKALRYPMQAVLVSPHFLYKIEQPVPVGEIRALNDFELATALSYFLWSSMPDAELFKLANQGKLKDKAVFREQVLRMLKDKRAKAVVQNFATQWLQLRALARMQPDADLFPGVDAQLRKDMETETKLLVYDLIRRDAKVTDLLRADYTFLNERLARHYGVKGITGPKFQKVTSGKTRRQGILTHASILTLTSNPNRTSPVKRGKWIMENLLGEEPPPPDPDAMQLEDQPKLTGTLRQRMEQHRADPACAVCHKVMDELGFALENYDAVGKWRMQDEVGTIDPRGELPDGTTFQGSKELQLMIRTGMRAKFVRCVAEKMLVYALGRGLEYYDECTLDKIASDLRDSDYRFSAMVIAICESDPFRKRFGEGASRSGEE